MWHAFNRSNRPLVIADCAELRRGQLTRSYACQEKASFSIRSPPILNRFLRSTFGTDNLLDLALLCGGWSGETGSTFSQIIESCRSLFKIPLLGKTVFVIEQVFIRSGRTLSMGCDGLRALEDFAWSSHLDGDISTKLMGVACSFALEMRRGDCAPYRSQCPLSITSDYVLSNAS
jgi:hypothetical protein